MKSKNSSHKLEICCFSLFSCQNAELGGADRIELCAGRLEGGTTPSYGLVKTALESVNIPIYLMIRPRGGDFLFNKQEKEMMLEDIKILKTLKPGGFVIGALNPDGSIDVETIEEQMKAIGDFPVTFHRAFDMCKDPAEALDILADFGIENILTSGLHQKAPQGLDELKMIVEKADGRIKIMAGSGVNPDNIPDVARTGVDDFHFSATKTHQSGMQYRNQRINMGGDESVDEFATFEADPEMIKRAVQVIGTISQN